MEQFQIDESTLAAYLRGELDNAQIARVEEWYDASSTNRKMLGEVYYLLFINDCLGASARIDVERSLRQLKARMHGKRRAASSFRRIAWRITAAAVVAVAVITVSMNISSLSERLANPVQVFTQLGERSQVVLPDGSKVWLNSCSRVEYTSPLFARERRVKMTGEAYFEVVHDERNPFMVSVDGLSVKVLGTKFNIRSDKEDHRVTTVLLEGAVKAYASADERNSVHLRPMQSVVYDTQTRQLILSDYNNARNSINWIEGRLHFDRQPFSQIAAELQRYYNVDITFKDHALRHECFSGDFLISDGIYHIMSVLGLTYKFRYEIADNDILLYAN